MTSLPTHLFAWLKTALSPGTVFTVITVAAGLAAMHGKEQQRVDDLDRRIAVLDTTSVRRGEFDAQQKALVQALQSIDARLGTIERVLMERK